jgi:hypothetical protein
MKVETVNLKSAIRFGDFYNVFGPDGVVTMAWWLGALHADRIRKEQGSFPFLQITGQPGGGKGLLLDYLWKLSGEEHFQGCAPDHASRAGRSRFMTNAGNKVTALVPIHEKATGDWADELKPLYDSNAEFLDHSRGGELTKFKGAILIVADAPLRCSEAVKSRMQTVFLHPSKQEKKFRSVAQLIELSADRAGAFARVFRHHEDLILTALQGMVPAQMAKYERQFRKDLNRRYARNFAQVAALIEALCDLVGLSERQRSAALSRLHSTDYLMNNDVPF